MSCYNYYNIFYEFGQALRNMLLNSPSRPYPIYENKQDYDNDFTHDFKGILVWEAQRYYRDAEAGSLVYQADVGFYVVPEFGEVSVITNLEYRQVVMIVFDSNSEPDYDPYGTKITREIDWFLNEIHDQVETINAFILSSGARMYCHVQGVSRPITAKSVYVRRVVTLITRVCHCLP